MVVKIQKYFLSVFYSKVSKVGEFSCYFHLPLLLLRLALSTSSESRWFGRLPWTFCRSFRDFFVFKVPVHALTFAMIWSIPSKCSELLFNGFLSNSCCEWLLFFLACLIFLAFVEQQMPLDIDLLFSMLPC